MKLFRKAFSSRANLILLITKENSSFELSKDGKEILGQFMSSKTLTALSWNDSCHRVLSSKTMYEIKLFGSHSVNFSRNPIHKTSLCISDLHLNRLSPPCWAIWEHRNKALFKINYNAPILSIHILSWSRDIEWYRSH